MRHLVSKATLLAGVTVLASPFALVAADETPAAAGETTGPASTESAEGQPAPESEDTTAAAEDSQGIQEIVITAQKRAESLQEVPISVTALTSDELAASNIQGQVDLPKLTPNLNFTVNSGFASPYIRGVGTQFGNPGLEPSVSVYMDDVYIPRASSALFGFADIKRIEVLKGPQGTLYGRNATGGAIRIITNDPVMDEWDAKMQATVGSYQTRVLSGVLNAPLGEGVAMRISAQHEQNRGYMRNLAPGGDANGETRGQNKDMQIYTAKVVAKGDSPLKLTLTADYARKDDLDSVAEANLFRTGPEQIGLAVGGLGSDGFYTYANDGQDFLNTWAWGYSGRLDYALDAVTLSSITGYRREYEKNCADIDGTSAPVQPVCGKPNTKQVSQELQVTSNSEGPLRYVAGLYYLHEEGGYPFTVQIAFDPDVGLSSSGDNLRVNSYAPFAQVDYDFSDQWSLSLGARYTWEKKKLKESFAGLVPLIDGYPVPGAPLTPVPEVCGPCGDPGKSENFNEFTYKATVSFKPIERTMLFGTISRGFKSGGMNLPAFGEVNVVDPEILTMYELGFKSTFSVVRWNTSVFYYDYKDLQISITDQTTGGTRIENAAKSRPKGVETDVEWLVMDDLEVGAGGGYLDAKYKDFNGDVYVPCAEAVPGTPPADVCDGRGGLGLALLTGQDLSGNRLVNAPKWTGYLRGQYTHDVGGWGVLTLSSILNYRSVAYFDSGNLFDDKKRTLLSAKIFWSSPNEKYFASVYGENLTDKKYNTVESPQATGGWRNAAAPRMMFVSLGMNF